MSKYAKRIIFSSLAILYFPLSIYGMAVCCIFCSWLIFVPVLIFGIFSDIIDIGIMGYICADINAEYELDEKELDEFLKTGGRLK